MKNVKLKYALQGYAREYDAVVDTLLKSKIKECSGLFSGKKAEKKTWQALYEKYNAGTETHEDAAQILLALQEIITKMAKNPNPSQIGNMAVIRGAYMQIATFVKGDMDAEKTE
ncbi:MAG: hypothetical protein K6G17_03675 [Oscillospiraceae bacterium]|nr:hypothetical protein [Oscillospiraceae bacterium]